MGRSRRVSYRPKATTMDLLKTIRLLWLMRRPKTTPPERGEHEWAITLIRQRGKFEGLAFQ
jgi:hypothetical protein